MITTLSFVIAAIFFCLFVTVIVITSDYDGPSNKGIVLAGICAAITLSSIVVACVSLNRNIQNSEIACFESGGYVYDGMCVDRIPVQIRKI